MIEAGQRYRSRSFAWKGWARFGINFIQKKPPISERQSFLLVTLSSPVWSKYIWFYCRTVLHMRYEFEAHSVSITGPTVCCPTCLSWLVYGSVQTLLANELEVVYICGLVPVCYCSAWSWFYFEVERLYYVVNFYNRLNKCWLFHTAAVVIIYQTHALTNFNDNGWVIWLSNDVGLVLVIYTSLISSIVYKTESLTSVLDRLCWSGRSFVSCLFLVIIICGFISVFWCGLISGFSDWLFGHRTAICDLYSQCKDGCCFDEDLY